MEDAKLKSRHVIDLRQSATAAPAKTRSVRGAVSSKPSSSRKAAVKPVANVATGTPRPIVAPPAAPSLPPAVTQMAQPAYSDPPPQRRFWPAFWRFLILVVVLGVVITGGVYLYLKYYT
jgi:hypothetical protein